jgi:hypothetical protein
MQQVLLRQPNGIEQRDLLDFCEILSSLREIETCVPDYQKQFRHTQSANSRARTERLCNGWNLDTHASTTPQHAPLSLQHKPGGTITGITQSPLWTIPDIRLRTLTAWADWSSYNSARNGQIVGSRYRISRLWQQHWHGRGLRQPSIGNGICYDSLTTAPDHEAVYIGPRSGDT